MNPAYAAQQASMGSLGAGGGSSYGSPADWAQIISAAGQGAGAGAQSAAQHATSKKEAREAKRRTLANLLNQALARNQNLFRVGQEYSGEMADTQSQNLQNMARGFVNALQGRR
jgi:hypothetical protein